LKTTGTAQAGALPQPGLAHESIQRRTGLCGKRCSKFANIRAMQIFPLLVGPCGISGLM